MRSIFVVFHSNLNLKHVMCRLKVTYHRIFLHHVEVNQFVDAAEYDSCTGSESSEKYQVTWQL